MVSHSVTAKSALVLTPWARVRLTDEQAADIIALIPPDAWLRISGQSARGPFMAAMGGASWDFYTDRATGRDAYATAMALLREKAA